ncbi:DUF5317 domain-containing protein [Alkaliphilus peptidifermentans]|uniref:DUF5317 domain-containing protein n=1 Tax=Alkaliphilus peptidifermentans DSM 18978 TaxID=1120976 RepID=A0A1G5JEG4_9FIRM|nr:DUF5317 domain-containing protein [Alkaliphilus peptidifermentans]SCY86310.1 hypothetical protein SAMN03080606_02775 [Alkaliphilus peptidifermentans DSM 18978]
MILEALILGMIAGKLRGGQFKRLGFLSLRFPFMVLLSFIILLVTSIMISVGNPIVIEHRMKLYILAYCLLFIVLFFNLHNKSIWFILVGAIANFAAIVLNQGSVPISIEALETLDFQNMLTSINTGLLPNYIPLSEAYPLTNYLGKRYIIPFAYPIKQIFSIGDALISIGLCFYIQGVMNSRIYRKASGVIKFDNYGKIRG